jgi:hypothetical protein
MKTKLLLFTMFIGATMFAQLGNVVVFSESGEPFFLTVNGIKINEKAQSNVKVEGAKEPGFFAVVTFENTALGSVSKNLMAMSGRELTYKLKNKKGEWKLVPFTDTPIESGTMVNTTTPAVYEQTTPVIVEPTTTTTPVSTPIASNQTTTSTPATIGISVNTGTTTTSTVTTTTTSSNGTVNTTNTINNQGTPGGVGISFNVNIKDPVMNSTNSSATTVSTTIDTVKLKPGITIEPYVETVPVNPIETTSTSTTKPDNTMAMSTACSTPMSSSDFVSAKNSIEAKPFSDTKMTIAKQVLNNNCVSTDQVKALMVLFNSDDEKIELAKYAYDRTADQKNYYRVNDAFTFSSSSDELDKYLQTK